MKEAILFRREWNEEYPFHLNKEEISHLKALRIFSEDKNLRVLNGIGTEWIYEIPGNSVQGIFKKTITHLKSERVSAVATAIPKGNRLEWLLQKGTELGLTHFYFFKFRTIGSKGFQFESGPKDRGRGIDSIKKNFSSRNSFPGFFEGIFDFAKETKSFYLSIGSARGMETKT